MQNTVGIYYINLASRPDRRAFMESQFEKLGLNAERIEAVTPADLTEAQIKENCLPHRPLGRAPGEVACSLSHIKAWKRFLASGRDLCIILEDDALLSSALPALIHNLISPEFNNTITKIDAIGQHLRLSEPILYVSDRFEVRRLFSGSSRTTGYILGKDAASNLLQKVDYLHTPIDLVLFNPYGHIRKRINLRHLMPAVVVGLDVILENHIGIDRSVLKRWIGEKEVVSDLEAGRAWRERTVSQGLRMSDRLRLIGKAISEEASAGPSKFMQDYIWGVQKYYIPFLP